MRNLLSRALWPGRAAVVAAAACLALLAAPVAAQVANPTVIGPIAATVPPGDPSHNYPFFATELDLASRGYVEQEYFIEGLATRYVLAGTATGVPAEAHPYRTRIVVRRPLSAEKFNGTVLVEWFNVTNNADMENTWFQIHEHVMRTGAVWVGVSAQRVGVNALRNWSPGRYGSLDVSDRQLGIETVTNDALAYDIFSQAAQAIRNPIAVDPLGGLGARTVLIATGHSQSASQLSSYVNGVEPLAKAFDAIALLGSLGNAIREDLEVPVWKVLSEYDVSSFGEAQARRPDAALFRSWEVAGTSHVDQQTISGRVALRRRDLGSAAEDSMTCTIMPFGSALPFHHAMAAGLVQLDRWVRDGTPMTAAPILETTGSSTIVRDSDGNARGGLRLPQIAVPIAIHTGTNAGPGTCPRWGYTRGFTEARICQLYSTRADYLAQVDASIEQNLRDGYLLDTDAQEVLAAAEAVTVSCWPPELFADLVVAAPVLSQPPVTAGNQVRFSASVSNEGTAGAADIAVRFLVDGARVGADRTLSSLAEGASMGVYSDAWTATAGSHTVQVVVDPANAIGESNEANNSASSSFVVEQPPPTGTLTLSPTVLWPPNHKLVAITQTLSVSEGATVSGPVVTSNEPQSGCDADDVALDWVVSGESLRLRAERCAGGGGRVYTVTYSLSNKGGSSQVSATVSVPLTQ